MKEYTDALSGVHIAKPLQDGYIPVVARINLNKWLKENPTDFQREQKIEAFWVKSALPRVTFVDIFKEDRPHKEIEIKLDKNGNPILPKEFRHKQTEKAFNVPQTVQHDVVLQVGVQDIKVI
jgi:hypothetical protein